MFDLSGKVALVAGGAGYLAFPVCKGLLEQGAKVVIADKADEKLDASLHELEKRFPRETYHGIPCDIRIEESINEVISKTVEQFESLSILINATAGSAKKQFDELTAEDFDTANHMNITSSFLLARAAANTMSNGGSIIMYTSMYGMIAPNPGDYPDDLSPNPVEYGVGKAAIIQMVKYLAAHYAADDIRVNALCPGAFPWKTNHANNAKLIENLSLKSMLGRVGKRDETVGAAVLLASDEASFITGQVLVVDGGITSW